MVHYTKVVHREWCKSLQCSAAECPILPQRAATVQMQPYGLHHTFTSCIQVGLTCHSQQRSAAVCWPPHQPVRDQHRPPGEPRTLPSERMPRRSAGMYASAHQPCSRLSQSPGSPPLPLYRHTCNKERGNFTILYLHINADDRVCSCANVNEVDVQNNL